MSDLQQIGTELLKYRLSPWWREGIPAGFPSVKPLRKSNVVPEGYAESKNDEVAAKRMIDEHFGPEKANEFLAAIKNEILKLPAGMGGLPIHIIYPRRPRQEQNWLTLAFAEKLTETLAKLEPGRSFSVCHELYNINETTRTIDDKFVPSFEIRSRMASASLFGPGDERRLFIYADDAYAAGSTAAEALSFVHYHGGKVLAVAAMGIREFYEVAPSHEIKADFERRYPTNSPDRKKLDEILHLKGLTVDTLNHFELRFFSRRKPQFLEIRDTDYDLKKASPVSELTAAQKAFIDREKETRRTQQI